MPNRLSSHSGLKLGCLTTNTASARTARVKRRPFHSLNFAPLPNTAVLATEPTLCIRYAYDTGQIESLSGAKDGRWSGQDFVVALKEVLPDLDPVLAKHQALVRRLYRRPSAGRQSGCRHPNLVETNAVLVAAAKSIKSVAVLDAQIVAARCPIPRTMNLNCIHWFHCSPRANLYQFSATNLSITCRASVPSSDLENAIAPNFKSFPSEVRLNWKTYSATSSMRP